NKKTVMKLLVSAGQRALNIHDTEMVNIKSNLIQVDEIWTYVGKKQKQLTADERYYGNSEYGDQYVFVAIDAETKLVPVFRIGKRTGELTLSFVRELQTRVNTQFQLSSDSFAPYYPAVKSVFRDEI